MTGSSAVKLLCSIDESRDSMTGRILTRGIETKVYMLCRKSNGIHLWPAQILCCGMTDFREECSSIADGRTSIHCNDAKGIRFLLNVKIMIGELLEKSVENTDRKFYL